MKQSLYNFCYPLEDSQSLIYNSRTNALATLDAEHTEKYNRFVETGVLDDEDFRKGLEIGGYIVDEGISELEILRTQLLNSRYNNTVLGLTLACTSDCNFRCIYCYEKDSIHNAKMTPETENDVLEFIKQRIDTITQLSICWYGGEPLIAFDIIERLSPVIISLCEEKGVEYQANMVTNGYLLTPEKCEVLKKYKVSSIQVTLDGPEEIHDKRRPLAGGQGTFRKILSNLKDCVDYFDGINIRINTDRENLDSISAVKKTLEEYGIMKDHVSVYLGYVEDHNDAYEFEKCLRINQFSEVNLNFIKENDLGLMNLYPRLFNNYCGADFRSAYIIDSEGYIYKCWNDVGIKENNVGHIKDRADTDLEHEHKANMRRYFDYMLYDPTTDQECAECKCLPICMGGCPNKRLRKSTERCVDKKFIMDTYIRECANELMRQRATT